MYLFAKNVDKDYNIQAKQELFEGILFIAIF